MGTQRSMMDTSFAKIAEANETMVDLLFGPNSISDDELRALIKKRPHVYEKFAVYLGKR